MSGLGPLPSDHPLRSAAWIWPEGGMYLHNHFAHFRRDFELNSVPPEAPLFVTADEAYKLYVNGEFVCRGPARGYQSHWPFDEVDVSARLTAGHNWIAVETYTPGIGTFRYIHRAQAGFLCAARWGDFEIFTDGRWLCRRSPGHRADTARYSLQIDFQEHADARRLDRGWITSPVPPEGWERERTLRGERLSQSPFGRPPWESLEPRGIPLMREEIVTPAGITAEAAGPCGEGYGEWRNVSWGWVEEGRKIGEAGGWRDGSAVVSERKGDWLEFTLEPTGAGAFRAVTVDLGEIRVANLIVEAEGASGGEIVDFQHDQCLRDGRPRFIEPGEACRIALANRLRLAEGSTRHEFFHLLGFRHVTVIARDLTRPVTLRVKARAAGYPFSIKGRFECSDSALNDIHAACRRTQELCALDAYVDTPWREQAQWWGDARVQGRNTFYLDGDARLLARGIRSISGQSTLQGLTYGHAPTVAHNCVLPDFSLTWILTIWDHYWQTGELALFREQWPRVKRVLSYFRTNDARSPGRVRGVDRTTRPDGLLRHDGRFWYFGDWADLYKGEIPTFLNLWYLYTLRRVAELLKLAGEAAEGGEIEGEAEALQKLVMEKLYDPAVKMFRDGLDSRGESVSRYSVHEQTVALMLGLAPDAHSTMIEERLLPYLRGEKVDGAQPSAFWCTYVFEEMARRGYGAEVIDFVRHRWSPMLSTGTTWEGFEWSETSNSSCSHAWTAHPSYHLVNILAGVTQTAAGWREIRFAPPVREDLVLGVDRAEAVVPSPRGEIRASWRLEEGNIAARLKLPENVMAKIELPGTKKKVTGPCEVELAANVT